MHGDPCCDADGLSCDDPCDDGEQCAQECGGYDDGDDPRSHLGDGGGNGDAFPQNLSLGVRFYHSHSTDGAPRNALYSHDDDGLR